ncbi:hypothetical protein IGI04_034425 [Brassica rapa subsp. trilocularis]|uniref:Uncharacterized protein n=1 Tax=Brassica rapa subsp. trilocularis TaxID=1813537 RepID=A0ABQ7LAN9_BRACM|nr:hypothetical protein IGI04_034425 [Brassica rapa subsp. trilocularis]
MERFTVHAVVHYAHANMLDHTKDYEETKRVYIEMHNIELDVKKTKESMEKNWVPSFGIMKLLVNGLAKDSMVEEAKELIAQVKEEFTRNVDLWNKVEAALPH